MDTQQSESPQPIPGSTHDILFSRRQLILCGFLLIVASGFGGVFLGKYLYATRILVNPVAELTGAPTPETSGADTFSSEDGQYSLQFPQEYEAVENGVVSADGLTAPSENTLTLISSVIPDAQGNFALTIKHKQVTDFVSLEEAVDQNEWCSEISFDKGEPFRLDNEEAMIFEDTTCGIWGSTLIVAVHDNIIYLIVIESHKSYSSIKREVEQILSTFKFLDQHISQECGVCGPRGDHNLNGSQCAPGLECTNVGEDVYMGQELRLIGSSVYFCVKPGESISKCVRDNDTPAPS